VNNEYKHTEDMGEISGFGGGYEAGCQQMLHNGVKFLVERNKKDLQTDIKLITYKNIYGLCDLEGKDAEAFDAAVMKDMDDCTGAMHQAVVSRLHWINKHSWNEYCIELRKKEPEK